MQLRTLLPTPHLLQLDYLIASDVMVTLVAHTCRPEATCPGCGRSATRVQSRYTRTLADLPWHGIPVQLQLRLRRFFCERPDCSTAIFTERLPALAEHNTEQRHIAVQVDMCLVAPRRGNSVVGRSSHLS